MKNWILDNRYRTMMIVSAVIFLGNMFFADRVGAFNYEGLFLTTGKFYYTCIAINILAIGGLLFGFALSAVMGEWDYTTTGEEAE